MKLRLLMALLPLCYGTSAAAMSLDINLNEDVAEVTYSTFIGGSSYGRSLLTAGFLYDDEPPQSDAVASVGLHVLDLVGSKTPGLRVGVGGQIFFGDIDKQDTFALALGGLVDFRPQKFKRLNFAGEVHYAPDIVSFMDADKFIRSAARIEYSILPQADVYLGVRKIKIKTERTTHNSGEDAHVGLRIKF